MESCKNAKGNNLQLKFSSTTYAWENLVQLQLLLCIAASVVLEVACWPLVPKLVGSHPAEALGFIGRKTPQHAFLRRGSKALGPMS